MSDLGLLTYYLGIEVHSSRIHLCQCAYAHILWEKMGLEEYNPSVTPMEARLHLIKASAEALVAAMDYRSVVGALRYLIHTRPDLTHSVSYVSRFMAKPHGNHQADVKRILRYIAGTWDHGVHYARGKPGELLLLGYSDSDHGGDIEASKSTSGILFYLGRNPST
jgi:hypothetical protein